MKKEKQIITPDEIKAKEIDAMASANALIEETKNGTRSSPKTEFLHSIEGFIIKLVEGRVPYRKIALWIEDTYAFKVSEQMIRNYANNVLKISTKKESKNILDEINNGTINHPTSASNQTTIKEQKRALANKELSHTEQEETL